jgi:hypothetical protein
MPYDCQVFHSNFCASWYFLGSDPSDNYHLLVETIVEVKGLTRGYDGVKIVLLPGISRLLERKGTGSSFGKKRAII